jgi:ABC-type oligopeptide transport system substrate-binding subunit
VAKALLRAWDPTGSRLGTLRVGTLTWYGRLANEMKAEWQAALGLDVRVEVNEGQTMGRNARQGLYDITVGANLADYDSPQNWFSNVGGQCHATTSSPQFIALMAAANRKLPADSLNDYKQAGQLLAASAACPAVAYDQAVQLIKPWVRGAGGNALYENDWSGISIIKH